MPALRVGDSVLYEGKTWRVDSLGRHTYHREGDQMIAGGELHAVLLLEADPPGSQPTYKMVVPESKLGRGSAAGGVGRGQHHHRGHDVGFFLAFPRALALAAATDNPDYLVARRRYRPGARKGIRNGAMRAGGARRSGMKPSR